MKNLAIKKACALLSVVLGASSAGAAVYQERDEINRSFALAANARVDVSAISGSVDIKAVDGNTAIVRIERTGRSCADLDSNKILLEHTSWNLTVKSETVHGQGCQNIQVVYRVLSRLPRQVDVSVHGVSGPIHIGEIEGPLRVSGNSGN